MTTLADIRARIRKDLHDTDSSAYRWGDSQLDRHIQRALDETSRAMPRELTATLTTTPGSRDLSLSSLGTVVDVETVEYPVGDYPPSLIPFSRWSDSLLLHLDEPPATAVPVKVTCLIAHTLDASGTTLSLLQEDIVACGAGSYAALELSLNATDRLATGGPHVSEQFLAQARAREIAFKQMLIQYGRNRRLRARKLSRIH